MNIQHQQSGEVNVAKRHWGLAQIEKIRCVGVRKPDKNHSIREEKKKKDKSKNKKKGFKKKGFHREKPRSKKYIEQQVGGKVQ